MRRLGLALAAGVLFAGTSAFAQASFVTVNGSAGSSVSYSSLNPQTPLGSGQGSNTDANGRGGTDYNSFVSINPSQTQVTFESSNVVSGPSVRSNSFSTVAIGLHNETGGPATFSSTITPAGMGFYLAPTSASCLYSSCVPIDPLGGTTFRDLPIPAGAAGSGVLAQSSFDFSVQRSGQDGFLFHRSGILTLGYNADGVFVDQSGLDSVSGQLINFRTAIDNGSNIGFLWDATPISFDIGSAIDQTLIYNTSVTSSSNVDCIDSALSPCVIAYSGFGDPVGAAGAVNNSAINSFGRFGALDSFGGSFGPGGHGLTFGPTVFNAPTFNDGVLSFTPQGGGVPEPATWMTLILGFGLLGGTLRRRRTVAAI